MEGEDTPKVPVLLVGLALVLVGGTVQPLIQGSYSVLRLAVAYAFALLCLFCAFAWRGRWPSVMTPLRASAERMANDFRVWFAIGAVFFVYSSAMSIIGGIKRNNEIVGLRNDDQSIADILNRIVLPRRLTHEQIQSISSFLQQYPEQNYRFEIVQGDEEASQYRADLQTALDRGGWHFKTTNYVPNPTSDLQITFRQTIEHSQAKRDEKTLTPERVLQIAFGLAGAQGGSWGSGGGGPELKEDEVVIAIGHRRRDAYAWPCSAK